MQFGEGLLRFVKSSQARAYTAVRRLPNPLLQTIRSWASSSPILLFIASVMPSRHDRLGRPVCLLPGATHE
jgi:hypothetical protein